MTIAQKEYCHPIVTVIMRVKKKKSCAIEFAKFPMNEFQMEIYALEIYAIVALKAHEIHTCHYKHHDN